MVRQAVPEGDSIHRLAAKLRPALCEQTLRRCDCELAAAQDWQLVGRVVERVEARGKNLLIHCRALVEVEGLPDPRRSEELLLALRGDDPHAPPG